LAIFFIQLVVVGMRVMDFNFPPRIGFPFGRPPAVIVGVHAIVVTCMDGTSGKDYRAQQASGKQYVLEMVS
jgi:hypothetical protein